MSYESCVFSFELHSYRISLHHNPLTCHTYVHTCTQTRTHSHVKHRLSNLNQPDAMRCSVLIHNVSHADMLVSLIAYRKKATQITPKQNQHPTGKGVCTSKTHSVIARPSFSWHHDISSKVLQHVRTQSVEAKYYPTSSEQKQCPVGFTFTKNQIPFEKWEHFHVKHAQLSQTDRSHVPLVDGVYFPLLAIVLPKWLSLCSDLQGKTCRSYDSIGEHDKTLILISGCGSPRNSKDPVTGNSTRAACDIIKLFVQKYYPSIDVVILHSGAGIFQYNANVRFINKELLPKIYQKRRTLAQKFGANWVDSFHLTLSLCQGPPARLAAIHVSIRQFSPDCLHVWQLKRFWHEFPNIVELHEGDIEFHRFETLEMSPSVPVKKLNKSMRLLVQHMVEYKQHIVNVHESKGNELERFWLRKSTLPVLAVLMVQKANSAPIFVRGLNMEVSLPTGSLCAERNAIGSALAYDPSIMRKDMHMIAVLALPRLTSPSHGSVNRIDYNPISPCGTCREWLKKIAEVNPDFQVITFADVTCGEVYVNTV